MICSTPSGSTAYNLSNGGPVLVRGLDAMAITFIAPHSLHARPLVVPRGAELTVRNATPDGGAVVLADGHASGDLVPEPLRSGSVSSGACSRRCRRRRSSRATGRRSPPSRPCLEVRMGSVGAGTTIGAATAAPYREPRPDPGGRARARARSERDHRKTGAGKTILAQAFGLLLGAKGDESYVGAAGDEAYVEAELASPATSRGSRSSDPRTRTRSRSPAASLPTAERVPTPGDAPLRGRTSRPPSNASSPCRPVRAAQARPAILPARGARPLLRRRPACPPGGGTSGVARPPGGAARHEELTATRRSRRPGSRSCARSSRTATAWSPETKERLV